MARPGKQTRLRYVEEHTGGRGGVLRYYFRKGKGPRTPLPEPSHPEFMLAYETAYAAATGKELPADARIPHVRDMQPTKVERQKQMTETALRSGIANAEKRARARKRPFDLSLDWALAVVERQGFRCALTGIPFFAAHTAAGNANPFGPSLDRIDPRGGYTQDNVRIVIYAINVMLFDWGHEVFETVANAYRYARHSGNSLQVMGASNG